jgi:spermidine synthase
MIRFLLAFIFLLIPTTLMGGTLPVIMKFFVRRMGELGTRVSHLYSINNLGAVAGGIAAGFFLIKNYGLMVSLYTGAGLNLLNALIAFLVSRPYLGKYGTIEEEYIQTGMITRQTGNDKVVYILPAPIIRLVLWVFAIEGFTTLAYEVIWARIFIEFSFDKTIYFSSTIVVSFIFGLSLGSFIISKWIDRMKNLLSLLGFIETGIGFISVILLLVFSRIAPIISDKRSMLESWIHLAGREYTLFFIILSIPTTLMGFTYPIVSKLYNDNIKSIGNRMGLIGFMDTAGSILGSFVAGFILIPFLGVLNSFLITVIINIGIGLIILMTNPVFQARVKWLYAGAIIIASGLLYTLIPEGQYYTWWDQLEYKSTFFGQHYDRIIFYEEGVAANVSIRHYPYSNDFLGLNIDGHNTAYTTAKDRRVNGLLGYLPYLLHPDPHNALVVGFGMGVTAHSLILPEIAEIDVAEIIPGVIRAAPYFAEWNHNVLENPKVKVYLEDGRSLIYMTEKKYDIITTNSIHPRLSNNIYTKDFYRICYNKLAEDGLCCQWIPQNWLTHEEYISLIKAFTEVFPFSQMWYINEYSTILMGSGKEINMDYSAIARKFERNKMLRMELTGVGIPTPEALLAQYIFGGDELEVLCQGFPVNTDNNPLVEFSRVINIAPDTVIMQKIIDSQPEFDKLVVNIPGDRVAQQRVIQSIYSHQEYLKKTVGSVIVAVKRFIRQLNN